VNRSRLFRASCTALATAALVFTIRGDIADALAGDFRLTKREVGWVMGAGFWGFTLSIIVGGALLDWLGMRRLLLLSAGGYIVGSILTVTAPMPAPGASTLPGFLSLFAATLLIGLAHGLVEAVINPLIATLFPDEKTHRLNVLHAWWPGGFIVASVLLVSLTGILGLDRPDASPAVLTWGWKIKMLLILLPAAGFAMLAWGQPFPATERVASGVAARDMFREALRPLFILLFACMWLTAATELGPDQWMASLIKQLAGIQGTLVLGYTALIMFALRFFAGPVAHRISPLGILTASSVLAAVGLLALSHVRTPLAAFAAATVYGVGKTYFWPTMLGVVSERFPKGGALLLGLMGGGGMLSVAFILPIMGGWYDTSGAYAAFRYVAVLPALLTVVFAGLTLYFRARGGYRAIRMAPEEAS